MSAARTAEVVFFFSLSDNAVKTFMFLKNEAGQQPRGGGRGDSTEQLLAHLHADEGCGKSSVLDCF